MIPRHKYQKGPDRIINSRCPTLLEYNYQRGIDDGARLFRVELPHQFGGTSDIGQQRGGILAFVVDGRGSVSLTRFYADGGLYPGRHC